MSDHRGMADRWNDDEFPLKGNASRLWRLIEARTRADADVQQVDARIWDLFGEELAVMFTDLTGFSRRVASFGIIHFLQEMFEQRRLLFPVIAEHDGILLKTEADSFLIVFKRARQALECAIEMQHVCQRFNERRPPEDQVLL
ncbi:MAG: adenylate/guanylate cyclase domain-containing protein, partial [Deltaproteobacteria bacterium]